MPAGQPFTALCRAAAAPAALGCADLHVHTTVSDGSYSPAQIVDLGRRSGLSALAITDHDTLDGIEPARRAAARSSLEIIAGVEISSEHEGRELHLLGYFFDVDNPSLRTALAHLQEQRTQRFHEIIERLRTAGVHVEPADLPNSHRPVVLGRRHVAQALVHAGRASSIRQAFARFLHERGPAHVPKTNLPAARAIELIRDAGGIVAWAHPGEDGTAATLAALVSCGLGAVEAAFPGARASRRKRLRELAERFGLAVTAGSDCHGPSRSSRTVGACTMTARELNQLRSAVKQLEPRATKHPDEDVGNAARDVAGLVRKGQKEKSPSDRE